ncbi:MAG: flavin reductase family protein [Armatimonadota bacterium]|nr:flavin reductase family protein [Armatimonadota bacterium]
MPKIRQDPRPFIYPLPVALVTCLDPNGGSNIITVCWIMNASASPPLVAISLRPHRYSTQIIQESGEFGVNIPSTHLTYEVDLCGTLSGMDVEKLRIAGLTEMKAEKIGAPLLADCPVNMECRTHQVIPLGSHILVLGEVVALYVEESALSAESQVEGDEREFDVTLAQPLIYAPGTHDYWTLAQTRQSRSEGKKP